MRQLVLLPAAQRDLEDIVAFVTEASGHADIGARVAARLLDQCELLAQLPGTLGRPRPEIVDGLRSFSSRRYLIFFMYVPESLLVVNILHSSRDIDAIFIEGR